MAYIIDILKGTIQPLPDHISLERYVVESSYVTKYLSRVVKDKALSVYHVLFHLSWFETGKGEIVIPWAGVGAFIRSEQGNIIDDASTVKRRLSNLFEYKCAVANRSRLCFFETTIVSSLLPKRSSFVRRATLSNSLQKAPANLVVSWIPNLCSTRNQS